jgi:hypothetical protein
MGAGPMTGRGAGYCAGQVEPGYANPAPRLGLARRSIAPPTPQQETETRKEQAGWLKDQLDAIIKRIAKIESKYGSLLDAPARGGASRQ